VFLTITVNTALDRVIFIDRITPGSVMRAGHMLDCVGGKGFDASVALRGLGQETLALGFVAGDIGKALVSLLESYGIHHDLVWTQGETRLAHVVVEQELHRHSHIISPGQSISSQEFNALLEKLKGYIHQAQSIIAGGSLPVGVPVNFYHQVCEIAAQAGIPVMVDSSGSPLIQAIPGKPAVIKMNEAEFQQTFNNFLKDSPIPDTVAELEPRAREVYQEFELRNLVITCGRKGLLAVLPGCSYLAAAPEQVAVNAAGAGDATSAALAWYLSLDDDWETALRWAAATGAAATRTAATAECRLEEVEALLPLVRINRID